MMTSRSLDRRLPRSERELHWENIISALRMGVIGEEAAFRLLGQVDGRMGTALRVRSAHGFPDAAYRNSVPESSLRGGPPSRDSSPRDNLAC